MKDHDVGVVAPHALEDPFQMVKCVVVAHGNQEVAWLDSQSLRSEFSFWGEVELIELNVSGTGLPGTHSSFGDFEDCKEKNGKGQAGDRRVGLGEQVGNSDSEQNQSDETDPNRNFDSENHRIEGNSIFAILRMRVAQDKHREALHGETPNHSERV